jgi:glycosyltransferase involved in cell wall biosynthesis
MNNPIKDKYNPGVLGRPLLSIIMPTYNRAKYILETIQSIRDQTYSNWELIILDDGSEDQTEELVNGIGDDRIIFIKAGRTGRVAKLKNMGLKKAKGEFIAFADSDDLWAGEKTARQLEAFREYPDTGFSLTGGFNFRDINKPEQYFYQQKEGIRHGNVLVALLTSEVSGITPSLMLRSSCLPLSGGFKEEKDFSDADFILSLATHFNAVVLYEPLVFRRLHSNNHNNFHWVSSHEEGIKRIRKFKEAGMLPASKASKALFQSYINFGEKYLRQNENNKAIRMFLLAWQNRMFSIIPLKKITRSFLQKSKPARPS